MKPKPSVYITYAKSDYNTNPEPLDSIVALLESKQYDLWYDGYLRANQSFQTQLLENSFSCEVFLPLLGINTLKSSWVHREIDTARAGDAAFIPIVVDDQFAIQHLSDFYLEGYNTHFFYRGTEAFLSKLPQMIDEATDHVRQVRTQKATKNTIWETPSLDEQHHCDIFMAMPFQDALEPVYQNHIKIVAEDLNLSIKRGDDPFADHDIMHDVWSLIYNSQVVIADCSGRNPNVFYEMGIAHTLGKPIIPITQSKADIPFDIRSRRYIEYSYNPQQPDMNEFEAEIAFALRSLLKQ